MGKRAQYHAVLQGPSPAVRTAAGYPAHALWLHIRSPFGGASDYRANTRDAGPRLHAGARTRRRKHAVTQSTTPVTDAVAVLLI